MGMKAGGGGEGAERGPLGTTAASLYALSILLRVVQESPRA